MNKEQLTNLVLVAVISIMATTLYIGAKPESKELDIEIVKAVLKAGSNHCLKIRSKQYLARASGLDVASGCSK